MPGYIAANKKPKKSSKKSVMKPAKKNSKKNSKKGKGKKVGGFIRDGSPQSFLKMSISEKKKNKN